MVPCWKELTHLHNNFYFREKQTWEYSFKHMNTYFCRTSFSMGYLNQESICTYAYTSCRYVCVCGIRFLYVCVFIYVTAFMYTCVTHIENGSQHPSSEAFSNTRWRAIGNSWDIRVLQKRKSAKRRHRLWVHEILKRRKEQGACHNLQIHVPHKVQSQPSHPCIYTESSLSAWRSLWYLTTHRALT